MRLALLGDIHGNHYALEAVLNAAKKHGVEKLLITGDLVGYYFWPKKVLELLAPWSRDVVRGNHENMLSAARLDPVFLASVDARYGTGLHSAIEQLAAQQLDQLCALPHPMKINVNSCKILLCHGAPWDIDQYIYPNAEPELLNRCAVPGFDFIVLGHTHYPLVKNIGNSVVVNPGSVGQPRNRQAGASWAMLNTADRTVQHRLEPYDIASVVRQAQITNPHLPYLWEVLERQ